MLAETLKWASVIVFIGSVAVEIFFIITMRVLETYEDKVSETQKVLLEIAQEVLGNWMKYVAIVFVVSALVATIPLG